MKCIFFSKNNLPHFLFYYSISSIITSVNYLRKIHPGYVSQAIIVNLLKPRSLKSVQQFRHFD